PRRGARRAPPAALRGHPAARAPRRAARGAGRDGALLERRSPGRRRRGVLRHRVERRVRALSGTRHRRHGGLPRGAPARPRGLDARDWLRAGAGGRRGAELRHHVAGPARATVAALPAGAAVNAADEPTARLLPVELTGPAGTIEGLLQEHAGVAHEKVALVCHPHPLYGGTLHNKVTHRVATTLFGLGVAVLRFNFRGVGKSEGVHDRGRGELHDALAVLDWLRRWHPGAQAWAAGFSFGSWVASRVAAAEAAVRRLVLVA